MADVASSTITIAAPPEQVLAVIADIDSYPEWTGQIKSAEVVETTADGKPAQARFVMDAGVLKDEYVLAYDWNDTGVQWELVGKSAVQKSQVGSYALAAKGERHRGDVPAGGGHLDADARDVQAQGREDDHGLGAEGAQEARRVAGLTS